MRVAKNAPIIKDCDLCQTQTAFADAPTKSGRWAYMCSYCWAFSAGHSAQAAGTIINLSAPRPDYVQVPA